MYMTKQKFEEIKKRYPTLLVTDGDVSKAFEFVRDMLEAETDALKEKCAYATRSIADMESAARQVFEMQNEIEDGELSESQEIKEYPKLIITVEGQEYTNKNGNIYLCTSGGKFGEDATMRRVKDGWTLIAHNVRQYEDGMIEWDFSTDGHWEK